MGAPRLTRRPSDLAPAGHAAAEPVRQLHGAAAVIGTSVLLDSAIEHYRGSFHNRAMPLPLVSSLMNIAASVHGMAADRTDSHAARTATYGAAIVIGAIGSAFHVYNVGKRVGGFRIENLFYGAPIGAPFALALSGLAGLAADRLAGNQASGSTTLLGVPAGRLLAGGTSLGLLGTVGEAGLLHFRGNFQNPAMYLPVTLPIAAAAVLAEAAWRPSARKRPVGKFWLVATALMGIAGAGFHAYGVSRAMGGWKNWRQNVLDGPPLPAPPAFSGLVLAGLAALTLLEGRRRE